MIVRGTRTLMERQAARLLGAGLREIGAVRSRVVLGVVGGRSVGAVLEALGDEPVDWRRVHLFMLDERLVDLDHPDSNYRLVASIASSYLEPDNMHPFEAGPENAESAVDRYARELRRAGGTVDVALLSSGEDGHIASLFPDHETIASDAPYFLLTRSAPKPPPARMSASATLIAAVQRAVVLFFGPEKQRALAACLDDTVPLNRCPAKIVRAGGDHYLLSDCEEGIDES